MSALVEAIRRRRGGPGAGPAIEDARGRRLEGEALSLAVERELRRVGERFGDRSRPVAVQADQGVDACLLELALLEAGLPVLSLPSFFTPAQRAHALAESGAQALVHDEQGCLAQQWLFGASAPALPEGTARISFTSGSTGAPRGLCLSAGHLLAVAQAVVAAAEAGEGDRHLAILPPGLLLETVAGLYATVIAGGTYVAASQAAVGLANPFRPDFAAMARAIATARATSVILVPEYLVGLVACLESAALRLPSLRIVAVGGARVASRLLERARAVGLPVRQGYGLTECGSVVSLHDGDAASAGSVGRTLGVHRVRLAGDGEILIDGPLHLGTPGEPRAPGVLHTGDLGRIDEAGRLWIEGRKSSVIVTSFGRNISPEWIEGLLLDQPAVAQVLVHGDGAPRLGALIVPRDTEAAVAAAVARVNAGLPEYARVAHWRRAQPFTPANGQLTGNGRLRRREILDHYRITEASCPSMTSS